MERESLHLLLHSHVDIDIRGRSTPPSHPFTHYSEQVPTPRRGGGEEGRGGRGGLLAKVKSGHWVGVLPDSGPPQVYVYPMLPFGLRLAPKIFNAIADTLKCYILQFLIKYTTYTVICYDYTTYTFVSKVNGYVYRGQFYGNYPCNLVGWLKLAARK